MNIEKIYKLRIFEEVFDRDHLYAFNVSNILLFILNPTFCCPLQIVIS